MIRFFVAAFIYLWFGILLLAPMGALLVEAFTGGVAAFLREVMRPEAVHALWVSIEITLAVVLINGCFGVLISIVLARHRFPGRSLVNSLVDLPFAVSPVVAGLMLVLLYGPNRLFGAFFGLWGIKVIFAIPGMILATVFVTLPFVVRELVPLLEALGTRQEEAAYTLGAGSWQTFWQVTLPSIRWSLAYGVVMTAARSLGEFGAVIVVSGNLISETQSATLYIYQAAADFNLRGAYSVALVLSFLAVALVGLLEWVKGRREGKPSF
ncbi:sulfate ABC transporter permease [Heliomicrobium gestii]|uniref:sulfate ABC transporter permease n=1 Tax=Heliomicrobium gestii TaxID=2699 RepID=UPI001F262C78|nr:sulfate ABC transporter permease subunit [Heliomicrobium gestii]MBM7866636.1 sulfate transport system permease protein [Heliomicrobium gestii]